MRSGATQITRVQLRRYVWSLVIAVILTALGAVVAEERWSAVSLVDAPGMLAAALVFPQGVEGDWPRVYLAVAAVLNVFLLSWPVLGIWVLIRRTRQCNSIRVKLDENLPALLAARLRALGHNVQSVPEERLSGGIDTVIWDRVNGRSIS